MVGGGRMRGHALPFEVDPELIDEADQQPDDDSEDDVFKELFPVRDMNLKKLKSPTIG